MSYFTELEGRQAMAAGATALLLVAGALTVALWPRSIELLTGLRPVEQRVAPDELPPLSTVDAAPFFDERDQIVIRVAEATTLRLFLDRNRLNKPYQRRQVIEQLGSSSPEAPIAAGTQFTLRLTPVIEDVPGTSPRPKPR